MKGIFGVVGFNLEKAKYANNRVKKNIYKVLGCKVIDVYSCEIIDMDINEFNSALSDGKILTSDDRIADLGNTEIGIYDISCDNEFIYKGLTYKGNFNYNLYLDNELISESWAKHLAFYNDFKFNIKRHLIYDLHNKEILLHITKGSGFIYDYRYLIGSIEQSILFGFSTAIDDSNVSKIDLDKFFDYYEVTDNNVLYMNNLCEITGKTSGDVIIHNKCTDLYLGGFLYPELRKLIIPPSIEKVTGVVNTYGRLNIKNIELYLSHSIPNNLKYLICRHLFGANRMSTDLLSFEETYGGYSNIHLY